MIEGDSTYALQLDPSQNFSGTQFVLTPDGGSGTDVTMVDVVSVTSGITETVYSGQVDYNVLILSGGAQNVFGVASATTIDTSGHQYVGSGGTATNTVMYSSASQFVDSGGTDIGAQISAGALQIVLGEASNDWVAGGIQFVEDSGTAVSTLVTDSGQQVVYAFALSTTVNGFVGGATQTVFSGGTASATTLLNGGYENIAAGGTDIGAQITNSVQDVYGLASAARVETLGTQNVWSGATASNTTIYFLGTEYVDIGGTDISARLSGGFQDVLGVAGGATISGGEQDVYNLADNTTIFAGSEVVEAGGTTSGTTLNGGREIVSSSGFADATAISGGTLEIASGGSAGAIRFGDTGILQLDSPMAFDGTISGFWLGDGIDLQSLGVTSGATTVSWTQLTSGADASGTLSVSSGAAVETLTLLGQYLGGTLARLRTAMVEH